MTLGARIALYRRKLSITQEALAQKLGVTNQAVSKWESDQCCPDVMLLPKIADIFEITLDALFGREESVSPGPVPGDSDELWIVLFRGGKRLVSKEYASNVEITWNGPVLDIHSDFSVTCDDVEGDITAGGHVTCDDVGGNIDAGGDVTCGDVGGNIGAGGSVTCDDVDGSVTAGCDVTCDDVGGNIRAGRNVTCG